MGFLRALIGGVMRYEVSKGKNSRVANSKFLERNPNGLLHPEKRTQQDSHSMAATSGKPQAGVAW